MFALYVLSLLSSYFTSYIRLTFEHFLQGHSALGSFIVAIRLLPFAFVTIHLVQSYRLVTANEN